MARNVNIDWKALNEELLARGIVVPGLNLPPYENMYENSQEKHADALSGTSSTTYDRPTTVDDNNYVDMDMVDVLDVDEGVEQGPNCDKERSFNDEQCLEADLIELIKDYRCLWDVSCRGFKETPKKQQAWREIAGKLKQDKNTVKKSWKNLRDNMTKCMKKRNILTRSGAGASELPQCKFFKELQFLKDVVTNKATHSNLKAPSQNTPSQSPDKIDLVLDASEEIPMSSTTESKLSATKTPQMKRKRSLKERERQEPRPEEQPTTSLDCAITQYLQKQNDQEKNADNMFCQSLVPILSALSAKKNRRAKMEIQKVLFDIEFSQD